MFNTNLQAIPRIEPGNIQPATVKTKQANFRGASFEPMRPEHYRIQVDDTVIYKGIPENKGFFSKLYSRFINLLAENSAEIIEIEEQSILPFEYKVNFFA